jgi:hypothetical protein
MTAYMLAEVRDGERALDAEQVCDLYRSLGIKGRSNRLCYDVGNCVSDRIKKKFIIILVGNTIRKRRFGEPETRGVNN